MRCSECGCVSVKAPGWVALPGRDPEDDDAPIEIFSFCPVCAAREFLMAAKTAETYT